MGSVVDLLSVLLGRKVDPTEFQWDVYPEAAERMSEKLALLASLEERVELLERRFEDQL